MKRDENGKVVKKPKREGGNQMEMIFATVNTKKKSEAEEISRRWSGVRCLLVLFFFFVDVLTQTQVMRENAISSD